MAKYGIDISEHNLDTMSSPAAWDALQRSKFTDFIILRRGYGVVPTQDPSYFEYYHNAKKIGINDISSYWFSYALDADEAKKEAENYLNLTNNDGVLLNAVIMDIEDNKKYERYKIKLTSKFVNTQIESFIRVLKNAGLNTAVYTSQWILQDLVDWDLIRELGCGVWNAAYSQEDQIKGWIHQYTDNEYIESFGPFDANIMY